MFLPYLILTRLQTPVRSAGGDKTTRFGSCTAYFPFFACIWERHHRRHLNHSRDSSASAASDSYCILESGQSWHLRHDGDAYTYEMKNTGELYRGTEGENAYWQVHPVIENYDVMS